MVHNFLLKATFDLTQAENRSEKTLTQPSYYSYENLVFFLPKNTDFLEHKC